MHSKYEHDGTGFRTTRVVNRGCGTPLAGLMKDDLRSREGKMISDLVKEGK